MARPVWGAGPLGPVLDTSFFKLSLRRVGWQDVLMGADTDFVGRMGPELELLLPQLDERSRRLVLGAVARAAGDGGIGAVAQVTGASWQTVANGAGELASGDAVAPGRVRRPGGGKAIPYGVYDLGDDSGFASVGTDHDTAA